MNEKIIVEGVVEYDSEDGGQALIATINDYCPICSFASKAGMKTKIIETPAAGRGRRSV